MKTADIPPSLGEELWQWHEQLARHSEPAFAARGELSVTYMTDAHRACARTLAHWMQQCGFDEVHIDAVGNVTGRYHARRSGTAEAQTSAPMLMTGSHYDTVRNGGKYDGRLGILTPLICVRELHRQQRRLPFGIELVAFAEEEGQRYNATFLGSNALLGRFDPQWLDQCDADGISMRDAMLHAGHDPAGIPSSRRDPGNYLGFVEIHIEQGPVLLGMNLPLGVVSAINGSVRYVGEMRGTASHAGTTPMDHRHDALLGVAELALYVEERARADGDSVGTIGQISVPDGSVNVVPGRCTFSLDLRAPTNAQRDALAHDVQEAMQRIARQRGLEAHLTQTMSASAAPSDPAWQKRWEAAVAALGIPVHAMPSGAGHDAMKLHEIMPQAMLFVRGQNNGISHNPQELTTPDDMQWAIEAFLQLLEQLASERDEQRPHA